jgi:acyl-CoA synthetase (AMP-forming)/AMP-acid ligase II
MIDRRRPRSLIDVVRDGAMRLPDQPIFTFLGTSGAEEGELTYSELDASARAIGAMLQSFGARAERVMLLYPPGLAFIKAFFGCLYGGAIAIPVPSANRRIRSLRGLQSIVADACPSLALTTSAGLTFVKRAIREIAERPQLRWLATDIVAPDLRDEWWDPGIGGSDIAYLQYTSGSTSTPKGVILRHADVLENSAQIGRAVEYDTQSVAVMWLPHFHDTGLVHGVIQPLFNSFRSVMMAPQAFIQRPFLWLDAVSRYQATHSGGPNFSYGLCTSRVSPQERDALDLRSWRVAYNAAEPVRKRTLDDFAAAFAPCGFQSSSFYPAYGLAEATLLVSIKRPEADLSFETVTDDVANTQEGYRDESEGGRRHRIVVGCGPPVPKTRILIACPHTLTECAPGNEGEIWISGPSVAGGYWNRPEETERTFRASLADSAEGPFLRTGDLGFLRDGELFVTGRIKDLVVIRGQNHYPQDIECTVEESDPAVRAGGCAAFSIEVGEDEGLVILAELLQGRASNKDQAARGNGDLTAADGCAIDTVSLGETIRQAVADVHGLYVHALLFLPPGTVPKTSSGKIQRHACKADFLAGLFSERGY